MIFQVIYATATQLKIVEQTTLNEEQPEGFENALCLLPIVRPEQASLKRTPWLIEGWVQAEGTTILSGRYKSLKSFFARQIALSVASGVDFGQGGSV